MQSSKEQQGEIRKPSSAINTKKQNGKDQRSLQENQRYQGNISCKDGYGNGLDPTEADLLIKGGKNTQKDYKKDLNDPGNHDGVITHLEPDILECEVKWTLGIITTNKASEGDGIPAELFQILKDDAVKVLYSICQ